MAEEVPPFAAAKGPRVLLVDDDPAVLRVLARHLTRKGFRVTPCASGSEAVRVFTPTGFDLVITDMRMPGMSGLDLLKALRKSGSVTPALVLTGYGTMENAIQAFRDGGVDDYLLKPLGNINDLSAAAARVTARAERRAQRQVASRRLLLLGRIVDWSGEPAFLCNQEGKILCVNRAAQELFGRAADTLEGQPLSVLAPPRSCHRRHLVEMLAKAAGGRPARADLTLLGKGGERVTLCGCIACLRSPGGGEQALVVTLSRPEECSTPLSSEQLTEREAEVARLIAAGHSNREIAQRLFISEVTVKTHVTAILRKTGARDRLQLAIRVLSAPSTGPA